jgi:glycosyltransferase involved in cell wall biosynthesis
VDLIVQAPLRLGILLEFDTLNGGENSLLAALDVLAPERMSPLLLCPPQGALAEAIDRRGFARRAWPPGDAAKGDSATWAQTLNECIQSENLDLIHANSLTLARRLGRIAPALECSATGHVRDMMKLSGQARDELQQLKGLACVSAAAREWLIAQQLPGEMLSVVHNGIDMEHWRPAPQTGWLHRELHLPADALLAVALGQICLRKGQTDLARAAVLLRDRFPPLHFLLVGARHSAKAESVAFDDDISTIFAEAGMEGRLHRLGIRHDVREILREADILIHPALQEPLGRVLLEAAACGTPIVATRVGGTEEILTHGRSAWLVPPGDPAALAEGVARVLGDEDLRSRLRAQARTEVTTRFSAPEAAARLFDFWRRAADTSAGMATENGKTSAPGA